MYIVLLSSIKCGIKGPLICYSVSMHNKTVLQFVAKHLKPQNMMMFFNTCINIFTHSPKKFWYFSQFFMALTSEPHCSMRTLVSFDIILIFIYILTQQYMFCLLFFQVWNLLLVLLGQSSKKSSQDFKLQSHEEAVFVCFMLILFIVNICFITRIVLLVVF